MSTMTATTSQIKELIRQANNNFETTYAAGNAKGMGSLYIEQGVLMPPGNEPIVGQETIGHFWQVVMNMGIKSIKLETQELEDLGDTAIEQGRATLSSADGRVLDVCKYVVVWKRINDQWKLHKDIWNTNLSAH